MRIFVLLALSGALLSQAVVARAGQVIVGFGKDVPWVTRSETLQRLGLKFVEPLVELDAVVAEMPEVMTFSSLQQLAAATPEISAVEENIERNWLFNSQISLREISFQGTPLPSWSAVMEALPKFEPSPAASAFPKGVRHGGPAGLDAAAASLPPGVDKAELPWGIQRVNAPAAWSKTKGRGVNVAVIDTGIDYNHPELKANYAGCYDAAGSGTCMDGNGHGTHVAGTIAGALDGKGVAGVAPEARLYAVKVLDDKGSGGLVGIIKGIVWCGRNNIQVANMSLGAPIGTIFMRMAVKYAVSKGVTVVAAAGNSGGSVSCPACYGDSIAVSASDSADKIAKFSSRGSDVDFIAPGVNVKSSVPGGGHSSFSGTSMASPHVAGLAAMAVSNGAKSPSAVRAALKRASKSLGLKPAEEGAGMIDAGRLVR